MTMDENLDRTGQHYMIDKSLIKLMVDAADLKTGDIVLEIGYGKGALTKELSKKCKVIAIDIEYADLGLKNVVQVTGNILERFEKLYAKYSFNKIVANIPYNISEPLMRKIFKTTMDLCVMTFGKNFSDILTKKDNRIGIIANHLFIVESLKDVSPKAFFPMPRVDSVIVRFLRRDTNSVYRMVVLLDDKKLKNVIERISGKTKNEVRKITKDFLFDKRLYDLSNEEFTRFEEILANETDFS